MMKRWSTLAVTAALACSVLVGSSAGADTTTPAQEAVRTAVGNYLQNLQAAVVAASQNPATKAAITPQVPDFLAQLANAELQVPNLTAGELDLVAGAVGAGATWKQQPVILQQDLSGIAVTSPALKTAFGVLSDCSSFNSDARGLFYGYWAAAQIASVANAVASGIPSAVDFVALTIIAGVAFGVANGIAIELQKELSITLDCNAAISNAALSAAFPRDGGGNVIPASSQESVNHLADLSAQIENTLTTIQNDIATITTTLTTVTGKLATAQGTSNNIQSVATDLQSRTDDLLNQVGGALDVASYPLSGFNTANGLANAINAREDTILANTAAFQALSLQMEIESTLSQGAPAVALLEEPAPSGYLQTVRDIVTTTTNNELAAGQTIGQSKADIAAGNAALAAHQYNTAYLDYQAAYNQATK